MSETEHYLKKISIRDFLEIAGRRGGYYVELSPEKIMTQSLLKERLVSIEVTDTLDILYWLVRSLNSSIYLVDNLKEFTEIERGYWETLSENYVEGVQVSSIHEGKYYLCKHLGPYTNKLKVLGLLTVRIPEAGIPFKLILFELSDGSLFLNKVLLNGYIPGIEILEEEIIPERRINLDDFKEKFKTWYKNGGEKDVKFAIPDTDEFVEGLSEEDILKIANDCGIELKLL